MNVYITVVYMYINKEFYTWQVKVSAHTVELSAAHIHEHDPANEQKSGIKLNK